MRTEVIPRGSAVYAALERIKSLVMTFGDYELQPVKLLSLSTFETIVSDETKVSILRLVARGVDTAAELSQRIGASKTGVYRYLKSLLKSGFLVKRGKRYYPSARLYLVYVVETYQDGSPCIRLVKDRGAIVDSGDMILLRGPQCECSSCPERPKCLNAVRKIARLLDVKLRSTEPLAAFKEIVECVVTRDIPALLRRACLVIEVPELSLENQA